jgi:hypothetical protein
VSKDSEYPLGGILGDYRMQVRRAVTPALDVLTRGKDSPQARELYIDERL